jgi:hypothetical protein
MALIAGDRKMPYTFLMPDRQSTMAPAALDEPAESLAARVRADIKATDAPQTAATWAVSVLMR